MDSHDLLTGVLSTYVMISIWLLACIVCILLAKRSKAFGLLVLAGGMVPQLIFYIYKLFNVWHDGNVAEAVLYSRIADATIAITIILSLWLMHRSWKHDNGRLSDF